MSLSKPDIPKKMAARIRAAQARVKDLRDNLVNCNKRRLQAKAELKAFNRDPKAYAFLHYGGKSVDSYPVQTRILRVTEEFEYRTRRIAELQKEIPDAEAALGAVEDSVLAEVGAMRMTSGRVPWPDDLPSIEGRVEKGLKKQQREINAEPARIAAYRARLEADSKREQEILDNQTEREDAAERRRFAALPPEQQAAERESNRMFLQVLKERGLAPKDLFSGLGVSDIFDEIEREANNRMAKRDTGS
ncbi:hypothetical protein J3456_18770 [Sulfitobacter sp. NFXS29]|uniref:hypothetical protein n=1 Tax=Sulfitobacter sp. NFXS29 TaxID=2818438 RepID=UPI0032DE31F8